VNDNTASELDPALDEEEALYLDENGIPMLFDVVVPGDYLRAAGTSLDLPRGPTAPLPEDWGAVDDQRQALREQIEQAIDAALPPAIERATRIMRETLLEEVERALYSDDETTVQRP